MIEKIKKITNHSVARNSLALFIIQISNMVAPLIVLPYLSRVLGIEGFGLVMLSLSICAIGMIITDYGFNISATYTISKKRDNKIYVSELIGAIFIIKVALAFIIVFVIIAYSQISKSDYWDVELYVYIFLNILSQTFFSTWFFQGIEKMKSITFYMLFSKIIYLILVFIFINDEMDKNSVILFYAISNALATFFVIRTIYSNGYAIKIPRQIKIIDVFKDSSQFFLSRAATSIYTTASTFLVGSFAGVQQAALYSASEKIYIASQSITGSVSRALFPYMAKNKEQNLLFKILVGIGLPLTLGCTLISYFATDIILLVFGRDFVDAAPVLNIFLIITVINYLSVNLGYPAFALIDKVNIANSTVICGSFVQVLNLSILYFSDYFSALHVAYSILVTESFVLVLRICFYNYYRNKSRS